MLLPALVMGLFKRSKSSDTKAAFHGKYDGAAEQSNGVNKSVQQARSNGQLQTSAAHQAPPLPEISLPRPPNPETDPVGYLRSIYAVREQTQKVMARAKLNELKHFKVDMSKLPEVATYVVSIIKVRDEGHDCGVITSNSKVAGLCAKFCLDTSSRPLAAL